MPHAALYSYLRPEDRVGPAELVDNQNNLAFFQSKKVLAEIFASQKSSLR